MTPIGITGFPAIGFSILDNHSNAFFKTPGIDQLYSGELISTASASAINFLNCSLPGRHFVVFIVIRKDSNFGNFKFKKVLYLFSIVFTNCILHESFRRLPTSATIFINLSPHFTLFTTALYVQNTHSIHSKKNIYS